MLAVADRIPGHRIDWHLSKSPAMKLPDGWKKTIGKESRERNPHLSNWNRKMESERIGWVARASVRYILLLPKEKPKTPTR